MVATFAYDAASRRTSRTLGDTPGTQTAWVYGRQDNLPTAINSGVAGASFSYTYDANKNKLTEGISAPMANYGFNSTAYDPADRLTAWNRTDGNLDQAWNLSLVGNWATFTENQVQQTRSHTSVHEIAAIDSNPIAHDPAGNLTRNAGDTLDRYTWDFDNRLATADVDQDGTPECAYRYDALGRRVSKTVPDGEGSTTTVFVGTIQAVTHSPHAAQVVAEYAADAFPASPERKFVYAEYIDEPVMMLATSGATTTSYYYHQNSLYSVSAITDASGTVVERYAYSAYGRPIFLDASANLLDPQASTIGNPYLFTGRRLDEHTGLYYYRARMYDAELGRFVGRDPIGYTAGWHLYNYVENKPLHRLDPTGFAPGELVECRTMKNSAPLTDWTNAAAFIAPGGCAGGTGPGVVQELRCYQKRTVRFHSMCPCECNNFSEPPTAFAVSQTYTQIGWGDLVVPNFGASCGKLSVPIPVLIAGIPIPIEVEVGAIFNDPADQAKANSLCAKVQANLTILNEPPKYECITVR